MNEDEELRALGERLGIEPYAPLNLWGKLFGLSDQSLARLRKEGLPAHKWAGRWVIQPSKGMEWMMEHEQEMLPKDQAFKAKQAERARAAIQKRKKEASGN